MNRIIYRLLVFCVTVFCLQLTAMAQYVGDNQATSSKPKVKLKPSYAWKLLPPLGLHEPATIDTTEYNYQRESVPGMVSDAWTTTGNLGAEGINEIWTERKPMSDFFFRDALSAWIPSEETMRFYNTRIPMTLLSFNTSGGRDNAQERLKAIFSGNAGKKYQVGAYLDYLYSKGSYANQATKDLVWGASGSYMGDRLEIQTFYNHFNLLNKENGGITDDLYITDPAEVQGGVSSINSKSIPTNLSNAHTRYVGGEFYINTRYKVGYWHEEQVNDTTVKRTYIPASSFIWTLSYNFGKHLFLDSSPGETAAFFDNTYLDPKKTRDVTSYFSLKNTIGIEMIEGFHHYAKFGFAAYVTHELQRYTQTPDTIIKADYPSLSPFPDGIDGIIPRETRHLLYAGAQLTKLKGSILTYEAGARFGLIGAAAGDIEMNGRIRTRIPARFDTISVSAIGAFDNVHAPYLMNNYLSNHFIWKNDFSKTRRYRAGGEINVPRTGSTLSASIENISNLLYFDSSCLPRQAGSEVQVFSARLMQTLQAGILHWDNTFTYQKSSDSSILPLPAFTAYSNLYLLFRIATLKVQFGLDCDYYTRFYAPLYQPATMTFHSQTKTKVGNYPFMNIYANMKLGRARFYVMFSHVNQGLTGRNYFFMPGYPMNPRRFQMGVSVDFAN